MGTTALPVITYKQHISVFLHFFWRYFIPIILLITSTKCQSGVMSNLFRPTDLWGPLSIQNKKISEYDEKAARITI
ncbi:hypothetical protein DICVIV_03284 [Dictyocaulus viviparus]|uniref:Uncharacterized protein n=1 Tax=Dictyocaulus viviparus TaxID=29172 RepID=A0A0D8Y1F4_DICVI|nr:hypothetical protein DICVIV_03284 [Dictyocaulus viviparus]